MKSLSSEVLYMNARGAKKNTIPDKLLTSTRVGSKRVPYMNACGSAKIREILEPALPYMKECGGKKHMKSLGRHFLYINARWGKKHVKSLSRHVRFMNEGGGKR